MWSALKRTSRWHPVCAFPASARGFSSDVIDVVVVGAGVIGLACAKALSEKGVEVLLLEKESHVGTETSARHSSVIHAGLYYPKDSLKARLCVEGKHRLYDYCTLHDIPFKRLSKLIVASSEKQLDALKALQQTAKQNGVPDLELLSAAEAGSLEPSLQCSAALLSPSTGIIDSHEYMQALLADGEASGCQLALNSRVLGGDVEGKVKLLKVADATTGEQLELRTRNVVNAAGLHAQRLASSLNGFPSSLVPPQFLAKGNYFSLRHRSPFSRLIYPLPEPGGLGTHLTLDMAGEARFGPDVEWIDRIDYEVNESRLPAFYSAIRSYYPTLPDGALQAAYCGIRPKISGPGEPAADFLIQGPSSHGVAGLVNLFGVESPGLTSSLAIADRVVQMVLQGR